MRYAQQDNIKTRLTNRAHLAVAVEKLLDQGIAEELIPAYLARIFYVDLDELNAALEAVQRARRQEKADQREDLPAVA